MLIAVILTLQDPTEKLPHDPANLGQPVKVTAMSI
jgi:hypothetical protein